MFLSNYTGNLTSWPLEKYAKFIGTPQGPSTNPNQSQPGQWKQFSSQDNSLQVSLLETNHLLVSNGGTVHESFSLFDAEKWMKLTVKGDSVLVFHKVNQDTRRFRMKFNKHGSLSALENCREFVSRMSCLVPIKEISSTSELDSQVRAEESQNPTRHTDSRTEAQTEEGGTGLTLPQLAQKVTSEPCGFAGRAYGHVTNLPTDRLNLLIRLCLTDSNFPSFVEAVQRELQDITMETADT